MTMCTVPTMSSHTHVKDRRAERRVLGGKRVLTRSFPGKIRSAARRSLDPCDNSNDSGLGFDHHMDTHSHALTERAVWTDERAVAKRPKLNVKLEDDEVNENYTFPETVRTCKENNSIIRTTPSNAVPSFSMNSSQNSSTPRNGSRCTPLVNRNTSSSPVTLTSQFSNVSRYADISLMIVSQPEQQHRARYQTEGSRGAVKDRTGNGFPIVQLNGYDRPTTLQVFIGTDVGKVAPHMFYQACRVSGKNSTPCTERKIEGTIVIELQLDPAKNMTATCDCVGILKERNVDVEHRFPDQAATRSKKKSTRCRMVFRTTITHDNGVQEILQICSQPIACTQPPGIPEISKKSLTSCPASGGLELFILGKNFLKDTRVFFQHADEQGILWEQSVVPDKEFLQQTHLVCVIPPYLRHDIIEPVTVRLFVVSSGKTSEPHQFVYTPTSGAVSSARETPSSPSTSSSSFLNKMVWSSTNKQEQDMGIMPPPGTSQVPLSQRRTSTNISSSNEAQSPLLHSLKQEVIDENSQNSVIDPLELHRERFRQLSESSMDVQQGDSNIAMITENSIDILRRSSINVDPTLQNINENSNVSITNENSMDMMVPRSLSVPVCDNSVESGNFHLNRNNCQIRLQNNCVSSGNINSFKRGFLEATVLSSHIQNEMSDNTVSSNDLNVIDLRMKMNTDSAINLASTTAPSLANLHNFTASAALPAQSAQSVENYLSSIESPNKDIVPLNNFNNATISKEKLHNKIIGAIDTDQKQILQTQKIIVEQTVTTPLLTVASQAVSQMNQTDSPLALNRHESNINQVQNMHVTSPTTLSLKTDMDSDDKSLLQASSLSGSPLQNSMATNITNGELEAMMTSVENQISNIKNEDVAVHRPQDMLIANKSPLQVSNAIQSQNILSTSQDLILNSLSVSPNMNTGLSIHNIHNDVSPHQQSSPNISSNISPEVILNTQTSPTMMCNTPVLTQENLLPAASVNLCQSNMATESDLIQQHINSQQQGGLSPLLNSDSSKSLSSQSSTALANQLSSVISSSEPEKVILLKAAVDLFETQKKITALEPTLSNTTTTSTIEQHIINDILTTKPATDDILKNNLQNTVNSFVESQAGSSTKTISSSLAMGMIASKSIDTCNKQELCISDTVKEMVAQAQGERKNEERMMHGFATMTENELINIINPSCFDQV